MEKSVVKNAFGALNKKKKKKEKESKATQPSIPAAVVPQFAGVTLSNDWADEEDDYAQDGFYDDGFVAPTKTVKRNFRSQLENNKGPIEREDDQHLLETDTEESESESEEEQEVTAEEKPTEAAKPMPIKETSKDEKEEVEDFDAILSEMALENSKSENADLTATVEKTAKASEPSEVEKAAEAALADILTGGSSDGPKKKKKSKNKKKKPQKQSPQGDENNKPKSSTGTKKAVDPRKKVMEQEKARMEKLKKKRDKSKFNQIPSHLLN